MDISVPFSFSPMCVVCTAVTDEPLCLNFLRYKPGTQVRIPVVYINDDASVDIKRGAYVVHINRLNMIFM